MYEEVDYLTEWDGRTEKPGVVFCTNGNYIRWRDEDYKCTELFNDGYITVYGWNRLTLDMRTKLLVTHWKYCNCNGFISGNKTENTCWETYLNSSNSREIFVKVRDLPDRKNIFGRVIDNFAKYFPEYYAPEYDVRESQVPPNLQGEKEMAYKLFRVAAFDPSDGTILLKEKLVSAESDGAANNQAVALLVEKYSTEDVDFAALLNETEILVRPF